MTLGSTHAIALAGLEGRLVEVEAHLSNALPGLIVSGLPDAACRQAPERIRAAAESSGLPLPSRKIVVNLSPAALPKNGTGFDLAIAVAILAAMEVIPHRHVREVVHLGELGLDGAVRPVAGVLPSVVAALRAGARDVVVPRANLAEASLIDGVRVHGIGSLKEIVLAYGEQGDPANWPIAPHLPGSGAGGRPVADLADVSGQAQARAALEVAAAGGHHLLLSGPPGSGKTMLAERMAGILPPLDLASALEVLSIRSLLGTASVSTGLDLTPPYVAPHHGASLAAMIGGGSGIVRPGAVSAAHLGVLFLDEAPQFKQDVLQALRQPLEAGAVTIARACSTVTFPARFQLVLAANPCPCGHGHGKAVRCTCTPMARRAYAARLSGPVLDRIEVQVHVPAVTRAASVAVAGEHTAPVAERVARARAAAAQRWRALSGAPSGLTNGRVPGRVLRVGSFRLPPGITADLDRALERGLLSLRGYDRTLRVAWTRADLAGHTSPDADDVGLALLLRAGTQQAA